MITFTSNASNRKGKEKGKSFISLGLFLRHTPCPSCSGISIQFAAIVIGADAKMS